ncbi:hypothetical protein GGE16_004445 [Rhizobium leguminosarum]|uniref:Uncharacterized protein n=1 Tax=Rhizobium leguminosarum TaxID=384 RepID=A0AAE2MMS8_RHILE|nr:hypothetical protein [Rhizobium leguminosarum]MBB4434684.1 hypothetical protein [Rhizobium esperanzae]MBB4298604.1 hypothetical protein [Rhizobium leguminosarum]MBB4310422.1 hypothetical protein [Rhizobium leguminosarum]MBB4531580.1 hypothetical protein [Rhizobium leguminosarum]
MRQKTLQSTSAPEADTVTDRLVIASRYSECLRRLSRTAERVRHADLATVLMEVARCIDRMRDDIAVNDDGTEVLRRAARLIGTVERLVDREAKTSFLH